MMILAHKYTVTVFSSYLCLPREAPGLVSYLYLDNTYVQ